MSLGFTEDRSTLVQVMVWCRQANQYLSQCWPTSLSSYGVARPQWVNTIVEVNYRDAITTLEPKQNGCHYFADDIFKWTFFRPRKVWISEIIQRSLPICFLLLTTCQKLVQIMAVCRLASHKLNQYWICVLTHIFITWPRWVHWKPQYTIFWKPCNMPYIAIDVRFCY